MRFLFITGALLLISYAIAKEENEKAGNYVPFSEQEMDEVVFSVDHKLAKEIEEAVKTINEVFGNPACIDESKRYIYPIFSWKRSDVKSMIEKREPESELNVEKRGWGKFWKKVTKAAQTYSTVKTLATAAGAVGKRSESEKELKVEKRILDVFRTGAPIVTYYRKRLEPESESKDEKRIPMRNRSDDKTDYVDSSIAGIEIHFSISKLERALEVLNDVLLIAKATVKSK